MVALEHRRLWSTLIAMSTSFCYQPAKHAATCRIDGYEFIAAPFAMPLVLDSRSAALQDQHLGAFLDLRPIDMLLANTVGLVWEDQFLYVFPFVLDAGGLGRMLAPTALEAATEGLCNAWHHSANRQPSGIERLIPRASLGALPLAFIVGVVITQPVSDLTPFTVSPRWRHRSAAQIKAEAVLNEQLEAAGIATPDVRIPVGPTSLAEALDFGLAGLPQDIYDRCLQGRRA